MNGARERLGLRADLVCAVIILSLGFGQQTGAQEVAFDLDRPTVLVTGANRGIGLAFAQHYLETGWNVLAAVRTPEHATELNALAASYDGLVVEQLDVTDNERIAELADSYRGTPIDVLINNAGVYGDIDAQAFGSLEIETFEQVMAVNVFAPMKLAEAFVDHVAASDQRKIVSITSGAGVLSREGNPGGGVFYGVSKTALNKAMHQIRANVADRGIIVALIAPGTVQTDMLAVARPQFYDNARTAAEAAASIAEVIVSLDESYDGRPRNFDGSIIPW